MKRTAFFGLSFLVLVIAFVFRGASLDLRPMHHDEANQAFKFGNLLETGKYTYDRADHHGPSLYYLSLPFAWLQGKNTLASLDEKTLRFVPALFGIGLLLLLLMVKRESGETGLLFTGLFLAVSPVMVYYSRFYIQEMLFVFFTLGFLFFCWRYAKSPRYGQAFGAGFFAGMMYVTKETCLIVFAAAALSILFVWKKIRAESGIPKKNQAGPLALAAGSGLLLSLIFYSSFFGNWAGFLDSFRSFGLYAAKAGQPDWHTHPFFYYIKMLLFSKYGRGPVWTEALILGLAVLGGWAVFRPSVRKNKPAFLFAVFMLVYTVITCVVFSLIPYKTPWNLLPFYIGFLWLAGQGVAFLFLKAKKTAPLWGSILLLCVAHLALQSYRANFVYEADPQNPYVYAQTSADFLNLVDRAYEISTLHPDGRDLLVKVVTAPYDTWPLPWYLRDFTQVGYWQEIEDAGDLENVPLLFTSVDKIERLPSSFVENHITEFYGLRPEVLMAIHIRRDLWDRFLQTRQ